MNPIAGEPVAVAALAAIITWLGGRYAVRVDPQLASEAAGVVLVVGGAYARQLVRPVAKDDEPANDEMLRKVVGQVIDELAGQQSAPANTTFNTGAFTRRLHPSDTASPPVPSATTGPPADDDG